MSSLKVKLFLVLPNLSLFLYNLLSYVSFIKYFEIIIRLKVD